MLSRTLILIFIVAGIFTSTSIQAQSEDETAIKDLIMKRSELLNQAKSKHRVSDLVMLYSRDFNGHRSVFLPDGQIEKRETDLAAVKRTLGNYSDVGTIHLAYKVLNIPFIKVFETSAVAIYTSEYDVVDASSNEELYGGEEIVTINLKKTADGWKIEDLYATEIRDRISKYPCSYELYQKDANELLVNVKVPDGSRFNHEYIDIRFNELSPNLYVVQTDRGDEFAWENNQLRHAIASSGTTLQGRPNSKTAVCEAITMHYYQDVCSDVKLQN